MDTALPLQQHPRFGQAVAALGRRAEMAEPIGAGARVLVVWRRLPVLGSVGYVPRGPVWDEAMPQGARAEALSDLARAGVRLLEAEAPCPSLRAAGFRQVATPAHVAEIDLRPDPDARRRALHGKWRNALRQAERSGLAVRWEPFAGDPRHWLLQREAAARRAKAYRSLPQPVACAYARATPGGARLLVAHEGDGPVAGMLFLLHPPVATYHIGWSGDRGRATAAHHLLLATACDGLAREGFVRLDLGTVDTEAAPGLARFKVGAGARVRPLGGSWVRLPVPWRFASCGASR